MYDWSKGDALKPKIITALPGPRSKALSERSNQVEARALTGGSANERIFWRKGAGANVVDVDGNRFLDLTSAFGVSISGHAPDHIARVLRHQSGELVHGMGDLYPAQPKVELAERIISTYGLHGQDWRVGFATSGADAVELALKVAYRATGRPRFLAFGAGFHGQTLGAADVLGHDDLRLPLLGILPAKVDFVEFPSSKHKGCSEISAKIRELLESRKYAAVIVEPIQGLSGYRFIDAGAANAIREYCDLTDTLLLSDEIFSGSWRTGDALYLSTLGIRPDIVCIGKALGGGVPIAAVLATESLWDSLSNPNGGLGLHGSTFGGDPLTSAGALAQLDWIHSAGIPARVAQMGAIVAGALGVRGDGTDSSWGGCVSVRGRGALWAFELNGPNARPRDVTSAIVDACRAEGVLVIQTGFPEQNVIGIAPPAVIEDVDLAFGLEVLISAIHGAVGE